MWLLILLNLLQEIVDRDEEILTSDVLMDPLPDKDFITNNTPENEALSDGIKLVEGDIIKDDANEDIIEAILGEDATAKPLTDEEFNRSAEENQKLDRNAITFKDKLWPKTNSTVRVPFVISAKLSDRAKSEIADAMKRFHNNTCIRFKNKLASDKNALHYFQGSGCYSSIGRSFWKKGEQEISIGKGCESVEIVQHEIMHALGFFHEHVRSDRDKYIKINMQNIVPSMVHNFKKGHPDDSSNLGTTYDECSLMHYDSYAFSSGKKKTIEVLIKDPKCKIGEADKLSDEDIWRLNTLYQCEGYPRVPEPQFPETCYDELGRSNCNFIESRGECSKYEEKCKKTCNVCQASTTTPPPRPLSPTMECADLQNSCGKWKSLGYCEKYKFMKEYCKKSCSFCKSSEATESCADWRSDCNYWKSLGHCIDKQYTDFMGKNCRKSCNTCN